jgi:hypothetical protein
MTQGIVRHRVQDFTAWKEVYDSIAATCKSAAFRSAQVLKTLPTPVKL